MTHDVVIVGGGPAGLSAALALGRGRKRVVLCDAGARRNAAAVHVHNFVTRDGVTPDDFRRAAREQLAAYPSVEVHDARVEELMGERGAFVVRSSDGTVHARRLLLCTGMIDELPALEGFRALWGRSIFQCPYCHGWEVQDRRLGALVTAPERLEFALLLRGWSSHVVAFTDGRLAVPPELRERLAQGGVRLEERPLARLVARDERLAAVELADGSAVPVEVLFAHPAQRQVPIVASLDLALDPAGYVQVDERRRETSRPGIYAAGDLVTPMQAAILAAGSGTLAAAALNHELTVELATRRELG